MDTSSVSLLGLVDQDCRRKLSKLALNVFTPALMLSKLGPHIDLHQALALWPIGANVIVCHLTGLALGYVHTVLMPPPPHLSHIIKVTTAISNVGNLPLVMVLCLVHSPHLHFNTAAEADLAVSYVMLGWFYATMVQMPIGLLTASAASQHGGLTTLEVVCRVLCLQDCLPAAPSAGLIKAIEKGILTLAVLADAVVTPLAVIVCSINSVLCPGGEACGRSNSDANAAFDAALKALKAALPAGYMMGKLEATVTSCLLPLATSLTNIIHPSQLQDSLLTALQKAAAAALAARASQKQSATNSSINTRRQKARGAADAQMATEAAADLLNMAGDGAVGDWSAPELEELIRHRGLQHADVDVHVPGGWGAWADQAAGAGLGAEEGALAELSAQPESWPTVNSEGGWIESKRASALRTPSIKGNSEGRLPAVVQVPGDRRFQEQEQSHADHQQQHQKPAPSVPAVDRHMLAASTLHKAAAADDLF
eukprot:gene13575-13700_t